MTAIVEVTSADYFDSRRLGEALPGALRESTEMSFEKAGIPGDVQEASGGGSMCNLTLILRRQECLKDKEI